MSHSNAHCVFDHTVVYFGYCGPGGLGQYQRRACSGLVGGCHIARCSTVEAAVADALLYGFYTRRPTPVLLSPIFCRIGSFVLPWIATMVKAGVGTPKTYFVMLCLAAVYRGNATPPPFFMGCFYLQV